MQAIPGPAAEVKRCAKCGEVKPLGEFHRDASNTRDGRQRRCKACQSPNQAAHARHQQAPALLAQGLKACTACGRILPLAGFAPDARKPSGRQRCLTHRLVPDDTGAGEPLGTWLGATA